LLVAVATISYRIATLPTAIKSIVS
jgi:hypothetical protein